MPTHQHRWGDHPDPKKELIQVCSICKIESHKTVENTIEFRLGRPTFAGPESDCPKCNQDTDGDLCNGHTLIYQLRLGHDHRNKLTEAYRASTKLYREIIGEAPSLRMEELNSTIDELSEEIKSLKAILKADKTNKGAKDLKKKLTAKKKVATSERKDIREEIKQRPEIEDKITANNKKLAAEIKRIRNEFREQHKICWGTYGANERAARAAQYAPGRRKDPKFKHWSGDGIVSVQLQKGITAEQAWGGSKFLQITKPFSTPEDNPWTKNRPDGTPDRAFRRKNCRTTVRIRVGSSPTNRMKPIWVEFPITMHRSIPDDVKIKWAKIVQKRSGTTYRFYLQLTLSKDKAKEVQRPGVVAVNLGWRRVGDNNIRAAYWYGDDGRHGEVILEGEYSKKMETMCIKQAARDLALNQIKESFAVWLSRHKKEQDSLPQWLTGWRGISMIRNWESQRKLASFVLHWRKNRFDGDEAMFGELETWRSLDKAAYNRTRGIEYRCQLRKKDAYRKFAAFLAREYGKVVVDNTNYAKFKTKENFDGELNSKIVRKQASLASPGKMRILINNACGNHGAIFEALDSKHITAMCHQCGVINDWDHALSINHWCSDCGAFWDQDANAAINLCRSGGGTPPDFETPGDPRKSGIPSLAVNTKYDWIFQETIGPAEPAKRVRKATSRN